ncbi:cupin domain-containing protein [Streptomyces sp. NBC_00873]|uniref:cupin domain-containing protein n=1 Tax=unclassified Streptomyces TaxID=2593676 RepID=UPI003870D483|nr:cupin domain-containing protein [Streptomyces sp. NBC_00873]WSY96728.1 cupin domain-containing protein [Streptomyces sp. NBC_00873]WTA41498.1 cupin domain-containing protein [Streptomyces sp. NBC_00842]WTA48398.1 cupin domain-containing protein [Streptomyces sp. NBC_00842]
MTYSDDVPGRARVSDTADLSAYYERLAEHEAGALWTVANEIEPWYPQPKSVPVHWSYERLRPLVLESLDLVKADDAGRRVVMLVNPGRKDVSAAVGMLYTGLQIMGPGESMTAHRHQAAALRFVIEGQGAWTIVDGQKLKVGPRDFAITPNWAWHEHGNEGDDAPVIWQDGLDIPLVNAHDAGFYEVHPDLHQEQGKVVNSSLLTYGAGELRPYGFEDGWTKPYSPLFAYPWDQAYPALLNAAEASDGSPYDGIILEYSNPLTGGSVMPTMGAHLQLLRPSQATKAHRHTGSVVYNVAKGQGHSIIAGQRFDWREGDIFCVPSWAWHEHANTSSTDDAVLFSFNDFPVMRSLAFWREEAHTDNDGHQPTA